MGIKSKFQEKTDPIKSKFGTMKTETKDINKILEVKDVIYLKTEAVAILVKKRGELKQFCEALDSITREGYEIKAVEEITDPVPKIHFHLAYLYIFQRKKFF